MSKKYTYDELKKKYNNAKSTIWNREEKIRKMEALADGKLPLEREIKPRRTKKSIKESKEFRLIQVVSFIEFILIIYLLIS
jgi:hypothetical protein